MSASEPAFPADYGMRYGMGGAGIRPARQQGARLTGRTCNPGCSPRRAAAWLSRLFRSGYEPSDGRPGLSLLVPDCAPELGFLALLVPLRPDTYWVIPPRTVEDPVEDPPLDGPSSRRCTPPSGPARSNCRRGIAPRGRTWDGSRAAARVDQPRPSPSCAVRSAVTSMSCFIASLPCRGSLVMGTGSSRRGSRIDRTDPVGAPGVAADSRQNPSPGGRLEDPPQPGTWVPGMPGHVNDM